jgi:hypothetical protein
MNDYNKTKKKYSFLDKKKKKVQFCGKLNNRKLIIYIETIIIKETMNESDKDLVFSENVKAGKRIYYFDVKQSRNGDKYIAITESKKIVDGTPEAPHFTFEKHKLFLYKEDYEKFITALTKVIAVAKGDDNHHASTNQEFKTENDSNKEQDNQIKIDIEF